MRVDLDVRNLLLASWEVDPADLQADLPAGVRPALGDEGRGLVSLLAFGVRAGRLGGIPGPSFAQLGVQTYVVRGDEHGSFLYLLRSGAPGLAGVAFGLPVRPARIQVRDGRVAAPGLGVDLRYRHDGTVRPAVPALEGTEIGSQAAVFVVSAGLRRLQVEHETVPWQAAELLAEPRVDPLLALGFDAGAPASVLYAERLVLRGELPPVEVG